MDSEQDFSVDSVGEKIPSQWRTFKMFWALKSCKSFAYQILIVISFQVYKIT